MFVAVLSMRQQHYFWRSTSICGLGVRMLALFLIRWRVVVFDRGTFWKYLWSLSLMIKCIFTNKQTFIWVAVSFILRSWPNAFQIIRCETLRNKEKGWPHQFEKIEFLYRNFNQFNIRNKEKFPRLMSDHQKQSKENMNSD